MPTRRRVIQGAATGAALLALRASGTAGTPRLKLGGGVNLAGAEFNGGKTRLNFDYTYPDKDSIDYFVRKGMTLFRIPFLADRLLRPGPQGLMPTPDMDVLREVVNHMRLREVKVILDMHQYGAAQNGKLIGREDEGTKVFAESWTAIASRFKDQPHVIIGLMNEPNRQSATEWLSGANVAIAAIRRAGSKQLILVPGSYWDGAHSWTTTDNGIVMLGVQDPGQNFAYEVHTYLDADNSGTHPEIVRGAGASRLTAFAEWCRQNKARAVLGEFGWADRPEAHAEGEALLAALTASPDVWWGWTYWAAGSWWGDYMYSVHPKDGKDRAQMKVLQKYLPA
jgi:endoglucanase